MRRILSMTGILLSFLLNYDTMGQANNIRLNTLTPEEKRVIVNKGTERPWSGQYVDYKQQGTYVCKWCDAPLYRSADKFDSHCGWPSFDDEIPGSVKRIPDADGERTEIICSRCDGHLGHVFLGEGFTDKNTRHCVNSVSLKFIADEKMNKETVNETAIFAAGCFWGVEHYFKTAPGVVSTEVGYLGGHTTKPSYTEVCSGESGHAEAIRVIYNPSETSFETLARLFFEIHDPTQVNRQGPDIGEQYRSEVFYLNENQKRVAENLISILRQKGYRVATRLTKAGAWWPAEDYHQDYYAKTGGSPYCHVYTKRF